MKSDKEGVLILAVGLLIFAGGTAAGRSFPIVAVTIENTTLEAFEKWRHREPLLYFVRQDFLMGASMSLAMIGWIAWSLAFWRRNRDYAEMSLMLAILTCSWWALKLPHILIRTQNLVDPAEAILPWSTSKDYLQESQYLIAIWLAFSIIITIIYTTRGLIKVIRQ